MIDDSWTAITRRWGLLVADLSELHRLDLFDPAVLTRPWVGVRTLIFDLIHDPRSRLHHSLPRR